jgi:PKD domain
MTAAVLSFTAAFTDPGRLDVHIASVDRDDGTVVAGTTHCDTEGGSHAFSSAGVYTVTVTLSDGDGGQAVGTFMVTVSAPTTSGYENDKLSGRHWSGQLHPSRH